MNDPKAHQEAVEREERRVRDLRDWEERVRAMSPQQLQKARAAALATSQRYAEFLRQAYAVEGAHMLEIEYELTVACDHYQRPAIAAPTRTVSTVRYIPDPAMPTHLHWGEAVMDDFDAVLFDWQRSRQTYEERLIELMGTLTDLDQRAAILFGDSGDALVTSRSTGRRMERVSWTFRCPDCADTLPLTQAHAERAFEGLRTARWDWVTLRELRDITARR